MTAQIEKAAFLIETRLRGHGRSSPASTAELLSGLRLNRIYMSGSSLRDLIREHVIPVLEADNVCLVSTNSDGYWTAIDESDAVTVNIVADSVLKRAQTGLTNAARMHKWAAQWKGHERNI